MNLLLKYLTKNNMVCGEPKPLGGRKMKISNVELAKKVCEAIPELDFKKTLEDLDLCRTIQQENQFVSKNFVEILINNFKQVHEEV